MSAPREFDQEFRELGVRLDRERLQLDGESKAGARRRVGVLLDVNLTLRSGTGGPTEGVHEIVRLDLSPGPDRAAACEAISLSVARGG